MAFSPPATRPFFRNMRRRTEVIAHRGGGGEWPEETLFAFDHASRAGADVLEMDLHSTADGELVLMHNSTVDQTTNGTGKITELTLSQIKALDAGCKWTSDGENFPHINKGITVPTLREVFKNFSHMRMNIEIKQKEPSIVRPFCDLIREFQMTDKVLVASFWDSAMDEFRATCPDVATSASTPEAIEFFAFHNIAPTYRPDTDAIQVRAEFAHLQIVTPDLVGDAHNLKLALHAWTVNDKAEMQRLISVGADGIITDYPSTMLSLPDLPPRL
jgi:glycerophosphoryl diester phosphodiesterase